MSSDMIKVPHTDPMDLHILSLSSRGETKNVANIVVPRIKFAFRKRCRLGSGYTGQAAVWSSWSNTTCSRLRRVKEIFNLDCLHKCLEQGSPSLNMLSV